MVAPVVAELRANFGDFQEKVMRAREEWGKTAETIRGTGSASALAGGQMERVAESAGHGAKSFGVLREESREAFGVIQRGVGQSIPGLGEMFGALGHTREAMKETKEAAREAFEKAKEKAEALKIEIGRVTLALAATERQLERLEVGSRACTAATRKAEALREQVRGLEHDQMRANAASRWSTSCR